MNKKPLMIALGLALGATMLGAAAFANVSSSAGYEVYKTAVKNLLPADSLTAQGSVSVSDNGSVILNANGTEKMNRANKAMSSTITFTAGDKTQSSAMYHQNGQTIMKDSNSDVYNVIRKGNRDFGKNHENQVDQSVPKEIENIIDLLAVNFDNNITLDNKSDGSKTVTLKLADNQITPLENAVAQLIIKNANHENRHAGELSVNLPQLVDEISLQSVDITAQINDQGQITGQTAVIKVTGKDASGQVHELIINADLNLSNINSTIPDTIDLTGKQVVTKAEPHE